MVIGFGQSESGGMVLRVEFDEAAIAVAGQFVTFADVINITKAGQGFAERRVDLKSTVEFFDCLALSVEIEVDLGKFDVRLRRIRSDVIACR